MREHIGYIYLLTNRINTVIYTGVTSDLQKRIYEHKEKVVKGFTKKYKVDKLVYDMEKAVKGKPISWTADELYKKHKHQ